MRVNRDHIIGIYFIAAIIGGIVAYWWSGMAFFIGWGIETNSVSVTTIMAANDTSPFMGAFAIFLNNALISIVFGLGMVFLHKWRGVIPLILFTAGANGFLLGLMGGLVSMVRSDMLALASIVPHGIVEIPAILIVFMIAVDGVQRARQADEILWGMDGSEAKEYQKVVMKQNLGVILRVVLPLLAVAAVIETWVTPWLMSIV